MQFPAPAVLLVEKALGLLLSSDQDSLRRCWAISGKVIELHIKELNSRLYFLPNDSGMRVVNQYDEAADASISGSVIELIQMSRAENAGVAMLDSKVSISGDLGTAERFSQILSAASIDWEELLSKLVGDTLAFRMGEVVRSGNAWAAETVESTNLNIAEYLSEEAGLVVTEGELTGFIGEVDEVALFAERLTARIDRLDLAQSRDDSNHSTDSAS